MQQLILTLLALLGLFTPTTDRRLAKFFQRFVPQLSSGRVTCDMAGDGDFAKFSGKPQGRLGASPQTAQAGIVLLDALLRFMSEGEQQPKRGRPDSLQRRIRRAQRAAGCRSGAVHHTLIPASLRGFFLAAHVGKSGQPRVDDPAEESDAQYWIGANTASSSPSLRKVIALHSTARSSRHTLNART